jgi:hypothetical protein
VRSAILHGEELAKGGVECGWSGTVKGGLEASEGWRRDAGWLDLLVRL